MPSDYFWKRKSDLRPREFPYRTRWMQTWSAWQTTAPIGAFTVDEIWGRRNGYHGQRSDRDLGSDLLHRKFELQEPIWPELDITDASGYRQWQGRLMPALLPLKKDIDLTFASLEVDTDTMDEWGTQFIADTSPMSPRAGLAQAIVEIKREGLPHLSSETLSGLRNLGKRTRKRSNVLKDASDDYLSWQFGFVPLLSDARKLAQSVLEMDALLGQLYRDSGRLIRRARERPLQVLSEKQTGGPSHGFPGTTTVPYIRKREGVLLTRERVTRRVWFAGGFIYHMPTSAGLIADFDRKVIEARYLFGLSVDPEVVWSLLPWSWLVDWFTTTGDVLANFTDNMVGYQVNRYAYVMAETWLTRRHELNVDMVSGPVTASHHEAYRLRQRRQATPYGFGLSWDEFSPYQLSILTALGISRGR